MPTNPIDYKAAQKEAVGLYRYKYLDQSNFNHIFSLNREKFENYENKVDLEKHISRLLEAAKERNKDSYFTDALAQEMPNERGIHGGIHAMRVAYYAEICLRFYIKYQQYLPQELQLEIQEFIDNPNKLEELKILAIMHDVAREHDGRDLDEEKNAFYAALLLEKYGYIRQEALDLAVDLAQKGIHLHEEKSLMSKLIESGDCLAILRLFNIQDFQRNLLNLFGDLNQIQYP